MPRFWYWPPWRLTNPWGPPVWFGGDEWGRCTVVVQPPLLGAFIFAGKGGLLARVSGRPDPDWFEPRPFVWFEVILGEVRAFVRRGRPSTEEDA
jgi:hypothetical protein